MKTNLKLIQCVAVAAVIGCLTANTRAGIFTWSVPTAITTADTTLNQPGTVVGAEVFGSDAKIVALANGATVYFDAGGSVATATGNGTSYGAFATNTTGNGTFDAVLTQFNYDGGPKTITLNNLVVGQQYAVQLFALDNRGSNPNSRHANFQDPADGTDISANFGMGDNDYVTGTFTASDTTATIQENLPDGGGNINALVLRAIGTNIPPQIASQPQPATIYNGLTATFSAAASGTGPISYQWQKSSVGGSIFTNLNNGANISGATSNALNIANLTATDMADYQVVASSSYGSVTSSPSATLMVLAGIPQFVWSAPTLITSAEATLNLTGTIVGAAVFGATPTVVTLTNGDTVDFKNDGSVISLIAGGFGTASGAFSGDTSNASFNAVLNQFTYDGGPDDIALNNLTIGQQYSVQLFALDDRGGASSANTGSYQDMNDPYDVSATFELGDNVYVVGTFTASNTTVYVRENLLRNNGGNINAAVLRAVNAVVAPQITTAPQSVIIDQGLTTYFSVAASGTGPLSYQWQRGAAGSGIFTNVPANGRYSGTNEATLSITGLTVADSADYQVVVSNVSGSASNTPSANLSVQPVTPLFIWATPTTVTTADVSLNQSGTIVGAEVFGPTPRIVVLGNGSSIDFKTDGSVATADGDGTFTGAFSGNTGNANFNAVLNQASYEFYQNPVKTITLQNLVAGEQYAVQLFALDDRSGTQTRYANFQDPADLYDYSANFYMPDNAYTIGTFMAPTSTVNIQENFLGSNIGGNINAIVVRRLSGLPLAPQITSQPLPASATASSTVQFTVGATGTSLNYQWQRAVVGSGNFSNVSDVNASGVNTAQLTITNINAGNVADYRIIVSNGSGSVTSSPPASLNVPSTVATLAHRWSFNETSGVIAHDSVGGADGTLEGTAAFGGGYASFNNTGAATDNGYVSIPGGLLKNMYSVSVECWVTNNGWANGNTFVGFGGNWDSAGNGTNFINFFARWFSSISSFQIQTTAGDSGTVNLGTRVNYNAATTLPSPVQYAYVYNPTAGTVTLYTNGVLSGSATGVTIPLSTVGTNIGTIGLATWNTNFAASIPGTSGNFPFMKASVSEVRIYNGILNSNAVADAFLLGPDQLPVTPLITTQPQSVQISTGSTAHFTVSATGNPLNYQWQRASVGSGMFTNVDAVNASGTNTAQLAVSNISAGDAADYRVIVFNGSGSVTSSPAATLVLNSTVTLMHRWSFSEVSGTTAHDSVGGADGTLEGGANFNSGYAVLPNSGSASDNSYVSIPGGLLNNLSTVTVECWVTNNGWANGNTFVGFGGNWDASGNGTNFIDFFARWFNAISAFQIQTTAGDSGIVGLGTRVNYNSITTPPSPTHYVYTYDPEAGNVTLYTNGVLSGTASGVTIPLSTLGTNVGTIGMATWNTNFSASIPGTSGNRPSMNAGVSEVRIYSGVLSSSTVAADFQLGPDQLPGAATTNMPSVSVTTGARTLTLSWPTSDGGFHVESTPVLGPNAVWTLVSGNQIVVGVNYQFTVATTNGAAMFFRLHQ